MTNEEEIIEVLAQTLAPRLFELSGDNPAEMGFPIEDSKEAFEERLQRQFSPVEYWTKQARALAVIVVDLLHAGGASITDLSIEDMLKQAAQHRTDVTPNHPDYVPPHQGHPQ